MKPKASNSANVEATTEGDGEVAAPPPYKRIRFTKTPSKFELYGEHIIDYLQYTRTRGITTKVHYYQREAVLQTQGLLLQERGKQLQENLRTTEVKVKPVLIVAPTGSGKSGMIALLPYVLKSKKVLVLTPSKVISSQLGEAFGVKKGIKSFFEKTGIFDDIAEEGEDVNNFLEMPKIISSASDVIHDRVILSNVVIVNAQKFGGNRGLSLVYKDERIVEDVRQFFDLFDTLLVDEAHHYPAKTWKNIVDAFSRPVGGMEKKIIFLTATPYRHGPRGEKAFILGTGEEAQQRVAYEITTKDLEGKEIRMSKFIEKEETGSIPQDIFEKLEEQHKKEPRFKPQALVIVRTKAEANLWVDTINKSLKDDTFAVAIVADPDSEKLTEAFTRGVYRVAIVCGLLKEGYDNPKVTMCVILRNIRSRILFSQFVGRCIRVNRSVSTGGGAVDGSTGVVLSYKKYGQQKLWDEREMLAEDDQDPIEVDED